MFIKAKPIFLKGLSREMNIQAVFECVLPVNNREVQLQITGATFYKVYLNDEVLLYGPARVSEGYASVDNILLDLKKGGKLQIEVASYNCHSLSSIFHPGFLIAEVKTEGKVLAATGDNFKGYRNLSRIQKVMRYSFQRHFSEVYHGQNMLHPCDIEVVECGLRYIPRQVPLPCMEIYQAKQVIGKGAFALGEEVHHRARFIDKVPGGSDGFAVSELEEKPYYEYSSLVFRGKEVQEDCKNRQISAGEYLEYDFGRMHTGFLNLEVTVRETSRFFVSFEEYSSGAYIGVERLIDQHSNIITYVLEPGHYVLENFDPGSLRHGQVTVLHGKIIVNDFGIRTFTAPKCKYASWQSGDSELDTIYQAAVETFRQNSVDIFMDCPARERAGWLCDSFFTGRAERSFTEDNIVERNFLRNFARKETWSDLPRGMMPMCYPGDVIGGGFIPQWVMWYVLELREALEFTNLLDREEFRAVCYNLVEWLAKYRNEDGLLEKLPGWNFVEWSKCNSWVRDVNYPTNFLYAGVLEAIGEIYEDEALIEQSEAVRQMTIRKSFDGTFFIDNAVRDSEGILQNTGNTSETCQYYALYFGKVDLKQPQYREMNMAFMAVFGAGERDYIQLGREIEPSDAFIGIYLRLMLLLKYRMYDKVLEEIKRYFGKMAQLTGTLWEHDCMERGSLNHGLASFAGVAVRQAIERT